MTRRRKRLSVLALVAGVLVAGAPAGAQERSALEAPEQPREVRLKVAGMDVIDRLHERGYDLAHDLARVPDGVEVDAVVTGTELAELETIGVTEVRDEFAWSFRRDGGFLGSFGSRSALPQTHEQTVRVVRADYFTTKGQGFLYVEARTTEGDPDVQPEVQMQLEHDTGAGTAFTAARTMERFEDSGEYMFHRNLFKVSTRPYRIRVTSSTGGTTTGFVSDWLRDVEPLTEDPGYASDFVDGYKHPQQLYSRFEEIAEDNPEIAEIIELPYRTNGYQRKAQATIGGTAQSAVVVSSAAWGHEGGNDVTVEFVDRPGANLPLEVQVTGTAVRVLLAKDAAGALASTAAQVAAAIEAGSQGLIDRAHPYRSNPGTGIVAATPAPVRLTDFLDQKEADAPAGEVPRGPNTIRVLRIGRDRDGSKPGVLIQAQDHAREWVPATITLETAERLVANYRSHPETRRIINDVDIFLIASNNPDGANYSFYNFHLQRKNMTNHCPDPQADPGFRNSWGVDLNRNYRVGSAFDGYAGGSFNCTSGTYQGPAKLSEPESRNAIWLVEQNPNIKFFMSVHSNGGQLFWQPGAYKAEGRITTPRPPLGHEAFYWQSADRILSHVRAHRQTVVTPENVGGSSDVLYSSAGNVREDLYNNYGIFAFGWEVGGSVYNPETGDFQNGSFQPPWPKGGLLSGHDETLEYSNGVMEMFRIAREWGRDKRAARSGLIPAGGTFRRSADVRFETTEPATIYYTTDGSRPTLESARYEAEEFREPGEVLHITQTTTFKWFSVDAAGNVENNYDPTRTTGRNNYREATIRITP